MPNQHFIGHKLDHPHPANPTISGLEPGVFYYGSREGNMSKKDDEFIPIWLPLFVAPIVWFIIAMIKLYW